MTTLDAEAIYTTGGHNALRLAVRGAVRTAKREGRPDSVLVEEVAVPVVRLANRIRNGGDKAEANAILEHAVHDGLPAALLQEAIESAALADFQTADPDVEITVGPHGGLVAGPPPAATDAASTMELANYLRDRLLS